MEIKPIIKKPISIFMIINKEVKKLYLKLYEQFPRDLYRISFSSEGIYGFVKGSHSWHSLPTVKLDEGEFRRLLNRNVYLSKRLVLSPLYFKSLMHLKLLILGV